MHGHLHCSQRIDKGAQTAPRDSACPANGCRQAQLGNNLCHVWEALGGTHVTPFCALAATRQAQLGSNLPCVRGTGQDTPARGRRPVLSQ